MHNIREATFYTWRTKYGGIEVSYAKRLKELEDENRRLKQMLADTMIENRVMKDVLAKKVVRPAAQREVVSFLRENHAISERRACKIAELHPQHLSVSGETNG
jgi:putative transposase